MITRKKPISFEWDKGNQEKNWKKHKVSLGEAEEIFFDLHKKEYFDPQHSHVEQRRILVGKTRSNRLLFVVYTIRKERIRVISVRDVKKEKERRLYEKTTHRA